VAIDRDDLGFLLAVASRRWNEALEERFADAGFGEVRASYGAVLVPLFEEDGLRLGELARRAHLSKQTMTTLARLLERDGLVTRLPDETDARATRVFLTDRATAFAPVAESILESLAGELEAVLGTTRFRQLRRALATVVEQLELDRPALEAVRTVS
jgi:DNA-binding MarR family transcriptional regulator